MVAARVQSARMDYWLHSSIGITMPLVRDNLKGVYDDEFKRCIMNCNKDHCGLQGRPLT